MSTTNVNEKHIRLSKIKELIIERILTVDFDKLEQRIYDKTVIKCG